MERDWIQYPSDIEVTTAFGPVFISITDGTHVYVDGSGNGKLMTVRGTEYAISVHLNTYDGGKTWEPTRGTSTAIYAHKLGSFGKESMPKTYQAKAVAEIIARVSAYLAANPKLLVEAAIADASNDLGRAEKELEKLQKQTAEKQSDVAAFQVALNMAKARF